MNRNVIFFILSFFVITTLPDGFAQNTSAVNSVDATDFYALLHGLTNAIVVDCRDLKAYKNIKIEGAICLENKEQLKSFADTLDRETPILVYCDIGTRSKQACAVFVELGFFSVYNLKGGLYKWQANDYPVVEYKNDDL